MLPAVIYDPSSLPQLSASPACFSGGLCRVPRAAAQNSLSSAALLLPILPAPICNSVSNSPSELWTFCSQRYFGALLDEELLGVGTFPMCPRAASRHEEMHPTGTYCFVQLGKGSPKELWPSRFSPCGSVSTRKAGRVMPGHPAGTFKEQPSSAPGKLLSSTVGWPTNNPCAQDRGDLFWKNRANQRGAAAAHIKDVHACCKHYRIRGCRTYKNLRNW